MRSAPGVRKLLDLVEEGLLAQIHAQTSNCKDCTPVGGIDARFSTNPIALAFLTGGDPVLAEFSTATMAMAKANELISAGAKADYPAFVDQRGHETDDASVMEWGGAPCTSPVEETPDTRAIRPLPMVRKLVALSGGSCNNPSAPPRQSFLLTVMDPRAFAGRDYFLQEMRRFVGHIKSSRTRPGVEAVRLPGERAMAALREFERSGLPLDDDKRRRLFSKHA